ncbi:MAG: hypothetical protein IT567_02985 [Alphaproteobacteria bacterium]|nr:hypothetical protein [Alphaproteobacteria bacterium]
MNDIRKIVALGIPVADILVTGAGAQSLMQKFSMRPGVRNALTRAQVAAFEQELLTLPGVEIAPGGSMANTVCTVARLCPDVRLTFASLCADDTYGHIFGEALRSAKVSLLPHRTGGTETSRSYIITDDSGERAVARYFGDSMNFLTTADIDAALTGADIVLLEGEILALPDGQTLWNHTIRAAEAVGVRLGLTLFGAEQVSAHRAVFLDTAQQHAHMVFGNTEEVCALYATEDKQQALALLTRAISAPLVVPHPRFTLVSDGKAPAHFITATGDVTASAPPLAPEKIVNTVGAGDGFMAGTFAGLLLGREVERAMNMGHALAQHVIQQEAAQLADISGVLVC